LESFATDGESLVVLFQIPLELCILFTGPPSSGELLRGSRNLVLPARSDDSLGRRCQTGQEVGHGLPIRAFKAHPDEEVLGLFGGAEETLFAFIDEDNLVKVLFNRGLGCIRKLLLSEHTSYAA
jgi:hypothetical protein